MTKPHHIIDVAGIVRSMFGFGPEDIPRLIRQVAELTLDEWRRSAQFRLHSTAAEYAESLQILDEESTPRQVVIGLLDSFPNMLEQGAPPWDLRLTVLRSPKAKTSKAGHKYMSIPFRHMAPGSSGQLGNVMPAAIHTAAKGLRATVSGADAEAAIARIPDPERQRHHVQRLKQSKTHTLWGGIPELDGRPGRLQEGLAPKAKAHHATDLYAGMYRMGKMYARGKGNSYMTFRTISTNIDTMRDAQGRPVADSHNRAENWRHPGFQPLNLRDDAAQYAIDEAFPLAVANL